jgi:hypothetical protein
MSHRRVAILVLLLASPTLFGQTPQPYAARPGTSISSSARLHLSAEQQTELAMSTAPREITQNASLYILSQHGYKLARQGTNGFSCLVEHQYLDTYEPVCYDPEGSKTLLLARFMREELRAAGVNEQEVSRRTDEAFAQGKLKAPSKAGFAYMMAPDQRVYNPATGQVVHGPSQAPAHLMFYAPYAKKEDFGGLPGPHTPFLLFEGRPDTFLIVIPSLMAGANASPAGGEKHQH